MRPLLFAVFGVIYLALLCLNIAIAPGNQLFDETFARLEPVGRAVVIVVLFAYILASSGFVLLIWRLARKRSRAKAVSLRRDLRDGAWLVSVLGIGSLVPMALVALMRGDSAGAGPFINGATVAVVSFVALVAAAVLALADRKLQQRTANPNAEVED